MDAQGPETWFFCSPQILSKLLLGQPGRCGGVQTGFTHSGLDPNELLLVGSGADRGRNISAQRSWIPQSGPGIPIRGLRLAFLKTDQGFLGKEDHPEEEKN